MVTDLLKVNMNGNPGNLGGCDAACKSSGGADKAACLWKNDQKLTCEELQHDEMHDER